jgi:hypothetical protein
MSTEGLQDLRNMEVAVPVIDPLHGVVSGNYSATREKQHAGDNVDENSAKDVCSSVDGRCELLRSLHPWKTHCGYTSVLPRRSRTLQGRFCASLLASHLIICFIRPCRFGLGMEPIHRDETQSARGFQSGDKSLQYRAGVGTFTMNHLRKERRLRGIKNLPSESALARPSELNVYTSYSSHADEPFTMSKTVNRFGDSSISREEPKKISHSDIFESLFSSNIPPDGAAVRNSESTYPGVDVVGNQTKANAETSNETTTPKSSKAFSKCLDALDQASDSDKIIHEEEYVDFLSLLTEGRVNYDNFGSVSPMYTAIFFASACTGRRDCVTRKPHLAVRKDDQDDVATLEFLCRQVLSVTFTTVNVTYSYTTSFNSSSVTVDDLAVW